MTSPDPSTPSTPATGPTTCPTCGEPVSGDSNFCEACGAQLGSVSPPPMPAPASVLDEAAPISAMTRPQGGAAPAAQAAARPCLTCGGVVGDDGYCETCGAKAPSERDHYREEPASWVAGVCDRGIVHHRNEDAMALLATEPPGSRAVLVVLDGVSSSLDSDVASLAGAKATRELLRAPLPHGMGTPDSRRAAVAKVMADAAATANAAVVRATAPDSPNPASATFAVAVLEGSTLVVANIGDSRVYWLPDAGPGVQLSVDDSGAQLQIEAGATREVAETSPQAHAITKWLGRDAPDLSPRVAVTDVTGPGWVLACSDGLWNYASEPDALAAQVAAASSAGTPDPLALSLALVAFANAAGGQDNITVALARVDGPAEGHDEPATPAAATTSRGALDG